MKKLIIHHLISGLLLLIFTHSALAETIVYSIRVDGLACPYCAYGIEKKFNELEGIEFIDMDLEKGIVTVDADDVKLNDAQLRQLFQDAGFTYRSKTQNIK